MRKLAVVILAAGQGTRMKSARAKVLHPMLGRPLIEYPLAAAEGLQPERTVVVVGVQADEVREALAGRKIIFALQKEQLGTGHAVMAARPALKNFKGDVLVLYGDSPLLTDTTLRSLVTRHRKTGAAMSLITVNFDDPFGYGRIIRDERGRVREIVEEKDCSPAQREIRESNPGIYVYQSEFLLAALPKLKNQNRQKEYYLTDLVSIASSRDRKISTILLEDQDEVLGINDRAQLARAAKIMSKCINLSHCAAGVTVEDPAASWIEPGVRIGRDTVIEPGARLMGTTIIGEGCVIEKDARIVDSVIAAGVRIKQGSVIEESRVESGTQIGPMAHLRPGSVIGPDVRIGNFVETKKAVLGAGTKASHLTYVGDAEVGKNVNLGCGFITCNYDGVHKHQTVIEDNVFVGSDSQTVAPVRIGKGAYIGSGSTIAKDIPAGALALTRAPLTVKEGWAAKKFPPGKKESGGKKSGSGH